MSKSAVGLTVLFVAAAAVAWWVWPSGPVEPVSSIEVAAAPPAEPVVASPAAATEAPSPRVAVAPPESAVAPTQPVAPELPVATLRVVDAASRRDLSDVQVLRGPPIYRGRIHPGEWKAEHQVVRDGASPVTLPPVDGVGEYWVSARGYAWQSVEFEHRTGGERIVALEPAAKLVVHLDAFEPDWDLWVRVYAPDARRFGPCLAERRPTGTRGALEFRGLRAGTVRVDAQFGNWWDPPLVVATAEVALDLSRTAEVTLRLNQNALPVPPVELAGTLRLPAAHGDAEVSLELRRQGGPALRRGDWASIGSDRITADPDAPRVRRWSFDPITPGDYWLIVHPLQLAQRIEVGAAGRRDVHVEVDELAEVVVRVRDEATGDPAEIEKIAWGRPTPVGLNMWSFENVPFDADLGGYRFLAPLGRMSVMARNDRYQSQNQSVQVRSGLNEVDMATRELPHRRVRLMDGAAVVPVTWKMRFSVVEAGGEQKGDLRTVDGGRAKLVVPAAGQYRVELQPIPGFDPVPARIVSFGDAEDEDVVVPLTRTR